ncbi:hypothetical protein [Streptomyces hydrogenans]|uniref:hypothetical protein n=1 Tax=Streptomyces hydrogenans TaxID=1873719 RepID=UPI0036EA30C6
MGAAAAGVLAVTVLGTGCGGGTDDGASGTPAVVSETPTAEVTDTELPFPTEDPYATEEVYETETPEPAGPEAEIDAKAEAEGWAMEEYDLASGFVQDVCEALPTVAINADSRPEFLVNAKYLDGDGKAILQFGLPKVCPKYTDALKQAVSGKFDHWYTSGTYVVSSKPIDGEQTILPGTYQAVGKMDGCYWERTSESGDIIDNNFATSARKITVTIRSSDGQFTSDNCETWKPVK